MNTQPAQLKGPAEHSYPAAAHVFDHERLDVYQIELRFIGWVTPLLEEAKTVGAGKTREVCDQLDRASLSCLLNTAEGNGKRRGQGRAKFFDDARGSATECAACLDALVAKAVFAPEQIVEGKAMLVRIVSMLCGLVERFDEAGGRMHEEGVEYRVRSEEEAVPSSSSSFSSSSSSSKEEYQRATVPTKNASGAAKNEEKIEDEDEDENEDEDELKKRSRTN